MAGMDDLKQMTRAQKLCDNAHKAMERGMFGVACDGYRAALKLMPHEQTFRRYFHDARIRAFRADKKGGLGLKLAELGASMKCGKVQGLIKENKLEEAMDLAEQILDINPVSPKLNEFYFDVAQRTKHPEAMVSAMEVLAQACPDDMELQLRMGKAYMQIAIYDRARDCFQKISAANPSDLNIQRLLKDADAKLTMSQGWEENAGKKGGFTNLIRNKDEAAKLDRKNKAIQFGDDAEKSIQELKDKIAAEPKNINYYRALARIYVQNKRFDDALEALESARKVNPSDPELDRLCSATKIQSYEAKVAALREAGNADEADEMETEKAQFTFDDLVRRVENYPNDLGLRYELGVMYYTYEAYDDAIQQLQLAQKSPKNRLDALYYLACCFNAKGQPDMAVMQLETANSQLQVMDDLKKRVVYMLGLIAQNAKKYDVAFNYFKDVYAADIGFKDVGERMQQLHKLRTEA